jgi:carbonic anhydrase/acetyltransferase-like protein (isoleucine patch superfamily)
MPIVAVGRKVPHVAPSAFVADGAFIIGDVELGEDASVWFHAVLRADINAISIGRRTNVQDGCVFHVTNQYAVRVGDEVTIGHRAIIHGCTIGHRSLIGMGSILLDNVRIGEECMIAAGAVVLENTEIPAGSLAVGVPARVVRSLTPGEKERIRESAAHYVTYAMSFRP